MFTVSCLGYIGYSIPQLYKALAGSATQASDIWGLGLRIFLYGVQPVFYNQVWHTSIHRFLVTASRVQGFWIRVGSQRPVQCKGAWEVNARNSRSLTSACAGQLRHGKFDGT